MRSRFLLSANKSMVESNIYADKSALVLNYLIKFGPHLEGFSLREVAKNTNVSVGRVQKVFEVLVLHGILQTSGVRTAKRFFVKNLSLLIQNWTAQYNIIKKCRTWSYRSGFSNKKEILEALKQSGHSSKVTLSLHSAAESLGYKNTNLTTLEIYISDFSVIEDLEKVLLLEPQEQGYEVLLIEPYYKGLLKLSENNSSGLKVTAPLLTFLDLYNFPLRGIEQAEFLAKRVPELKKIYKENS